MIPPVDSHLVSFGGQFTSQRRGSGEPATQYEKGRSDVRRAQCAQQERSRTRVWPIVKGQGNVAGITYPGQLRCETAERTERGDSGGELGAYSGKHANRDPVD